MHQTIQILNLRDDVVLQVNSLQVDVLIEVLYFLDDLEVEIQLGVHLWVFVEAFVLADYFQVAFVHYHAAVVASLEVF